VYANKYAGKLPSKTIVGTVRNKVTSISALKHCHDLQRELINSGKVDFVASKTERSESAKKKAIRWLVSSRRQPRRRSGVRADLMLIGDINTIAIRGQ